MQTKKYTSVLGVNKTVLAVVVRDLSKEPIRNE
jgi:hypothetical protein